MLQEGQLGKRLVFSGEMELLELSSKYFKALNSAASVQLRLGAGLDSSFLILSLEIRLFVCF